MRGGSPKLATLTLAVAAASFGLLALLLVSGCGSGGGGSGASAALSDSGAASSDGGRRARPPRGGEESFEAYGSEAEGSTRAALLGAFTNYLGAIAAEDPAKACGFLSARVKGSLARLAPKGSRRGVGCPRVLPALLSAGAARIARQQVNGTVTKVRVEDGQAFVLFRAPGAKLYQLTMVSEGGRWKTATVVASVLVPQL